MWRLAVCVATCVVGGLAFVSALSPAARPLWPAGSSHIHETGGGSLGAGVAQTAQMGTPGP